MSPSRPSRIPDHIRRAIQLSYRNAPTRQGLRGKRRRGVTQRQLSLEFGVSQTTVSRILGDE
jgi:hypothetical protein